MEVWKSYIDDHSDILEGRLPPNKSTAVRRAAECGLSDLVAEHFVGEAKARERSNWREHIKIFHILMKTTKLFFFCKQQSAPAGEDATPAGALLGRS